MQILRIILIGCFTFITYPLSPVFADDSAAFVECQQMKWNMGKKAKKNCFRDLARSLQADSDMVSGGLGTPLDTVPADNLAMGGTIPCPACDLIGNTKP